MAGPNIMNPYDFMRNNRNLASAINQHLYSQGVTAGGFKQRNINEIAQSLGSNPEIMAMLQKEMRGGKLDLNTVAQRFAEGDNGYALFEQAQRRKDAQNQSNTLRTNQLKAADEFRRNLPQYVSEEAGMLKKSLATQLAEARGQIKATENARGMLYSGRRQKAEGDAGNKAQAAYMQGVGNISQAAERASTAMAANPLKSQANLQEAQAAQNQYLKDAQAARQSAAQSLMGGYMGMIGEGVGTYMGGRGGSIGTGGGNAGVLPGMGPYNSSVGTIGGK